MHGQITKADYDKFDYLIGMDDANVRNIQRICGGDLEHKITKLLDHAGANRSIAGSRGIRGILMRLTMM